MCEGMNEMEWMMGWTTNTTYMTQKKTDERRNGTDDGWIDDLDWDWLYLLCDMGHGLGGGVEYSCCV